MIYDSVIWKKELKEKTDQFKQLISDTPFSLDWYFDEEEDGWTGSYKFYIELQKYCFYAAVITRKFLESHRLSDELVSKRFSVKTYSKQSNKILTKENIESIESEYDVSTEGSEELTLKWICHLFIHSFVFSPKLIEHKEDESLPDDDIENWEITGISGFYINTDHTKDRKVYFINLDQLFEIFQEVYEDSILHYSIDFESGRTIRRRVRR